MRQEKILKAIFETPIHEPKQTVITLPDIESNAAVAGHLSESIWAYEKLLGFDTWLHKFYFCSADTGIGPWRLQLKPMPELSLPFHLGDRPNFGLGYDLYYNGFLIGTVELLPEVFVQGSACKIPEDYRFVSVYLLINHALLLPYEHVKRLLFMCAYALEPDKSPLEQSDIQYQVQAALSKYKWETERSRNRQLALKFHYEGTISKKSRRFVNEIQHSYTF
ncbi:MAG: hypothetical protein ACR2OL_06630 [Anderseniella sp.]